MRTPAGLGSLKEVASGKGLGGPGEPACQIDTEFRLNPATEAAPAKRQALFCVLHTWTHVILAVTSATDIVIAPTLHMRKPKNREVKQAAQGHTARKC